MTIPPHLRLALAATALACAAPVVSRPPPPTGVLSGVVEVVTGYRHAACVRLADGSVECWGGAEAAATIGRSRQEPLAGPWRVPQLAGAVQLVSSVHQGHCAVTSQGAAYCFAGDAAPSLLPFKGVVELASGGEHFCARTRGGEVQCYGSEMNGALGFRPMPKWTGPRSWPSFGPEAVAGIVEPVQVAAGGNGTCVVERSGGLVCWGVHPFRAPHTNEATAIPATAVRRVDVPPVRRVALGHDFGCVLTVDGRALCARRRDSKDLPQLEALEPEEVMRTAVDVSVTHETACVVTEKGEVWCWGPGPSGHGIDSDEAVRRAATYDEPARRIDGLADVMQVSQSPTHACAVTRGQQVLCWGSNEHGERGDGTLSEPAHPTYVVRFEPKMVPGPPEGVFGCKRSPEIEQQCGARGKECALEPPPGYWRWGSAGGARCGDECMERQQRELAARPVPGCLCTCDDAYQRLLEEEQRRLDEPPPP